MVRLTTVVLALSTALWALPSCKEDGSEQADAKQEGARAPAQAEPEGAASPPGGAASQPSGAAPHGKIGSDQPPGAPFSGLIKLGEGLSQDDVKPTDVLFIMARESQGDGLAGRLEAVERHGKVEFPKRYELSAQDVMVPGVPFNGPFIVHARLDRDGDPMTKGPEDLYGAFLEPVENGQEGVHIVLEKGKPKPIKPPPGVKVAPQRRGAGGGGAASQPGRGAASQPAGGR